MATFVNDAISRIMVLPPIFIAAIIIFLVVFLFLPTFVAMFRRNKDVLFIALINLIFFYAFEVWLPLLAWAGSGNKDVGLLDRFRQSRKDKLIAGALLGAVALGMAISLLAWLPTWTGD
ncbi:MAG: hypothetical protein PSY12_11995 [bacterium]|nr:hypothetical protein [bacterium]